jgi:hypothetical protein
MPAGSRFYGVPTIAWVRELTRTAASASWRSLQGGRGGGSGCEGSVLVDQLSIEQTCQHRIIVRRGGRVPTAPRPVRTRRPTGLYFVTDRVAFPGGGVLGTYAFGLSGIQPNLPPGWSGGNQLAIHGTNDPSSIGRSTSAGCLRVYERVLDRLKRLLRIGTPVFVGA